MAHRIGEVEDITTEHEARLVELDIRTTDDLLAKAATPAARTTLASAVGVSADDVLRWANCADLMRVDGIGMQFADLLEEAGVDTIPELAQRNAANLHAKLVAVNTERQLTGRMPTEDEVTGWVEQAKQLARVLHYREHTDEAAVEPVAATEPMTAAPTPAPTVESPPAPAAATAAPSGFADAAAKTRTLAPGPAARTGWLQRLLDRLRGRS